MNDACTRNLQGLAKNCFGSLNSAVAASTDRRSARDAIRIDGLQERNLFVPICQNGDNACIPNPTGGPGYNCFPN